MSQPGSLHIHVRTCPYVRQPKRNIRTIVVDDLLLSSWRVFSYTDTIVARRQLERAVNSELALVSEDGSHNVMINDDVSCPAPNGDSQVFPIGHSKNKTERDLLIERVRSRLDECAQSLAVVEHATFVRNLTDALRALKQGTSEANWRDIAIPEARQHTIASLVHECPLTFHSFSRPRGYAGDAELLDLIYGHENTTARLDQASRAGKAVFDFTINVSACEAVRQRRIILSNKIDQVISSNPSASILAVACGHLREAELSSASLSRSNAKVLATDQDPLSLAMVEEYAATISPGISTRKLSVRDFITSKHKLGKFDLVYAAGLYDYLDERLAERLTSKLFELLNPGGRLLVANFLIDIWELPYMEAYMDWHLIYRDDDEIQSFANGIQPEQIGSSHYYRDATDCIGYLELTRV